MNQIPYITGSKTLDLKLFDLMDTVKGVYHLNEDVVTLNELITFIETKLGGTIRYTDHTLERVEVMRTKTSFELVISNSLQKEDEMIAILMGIVHLFCHMGYQIDQDKWLSFKENIFFSKTTDHTRQAYWLAIYLLISEKGLTKILEESRVSLLNYNFKKSCEKYHLSKGAITNRIALSHL